jgi:molybdopterin synthase catalytic subunit
MRVRVLFFGLLKEITGTPSEEIELAGSSTAGDLLERYSVRFPKLGAMRASIVLARNREFAALSAALADGDEVAFLPPVSGGASEPSSDIVEIVRAPIDPRALAARLLRGEDGALVTFEGVTRNHSGGRATRYLEYEAYEPMALEQMRAIVAELKQRWPVDRAGIVHRLGRLEIGETSVAIVVASAHRKPAFEACHYAIDRLKKIVPIWKKEYFVDGEVWVEGDWDQNVLNRR